MHKRRLWESFRDAGRGVWRCLQTERNMRVHLGAAIIVIAAGALCGVSPAEWACLLLAVGLVTAAEAMNTAVERLCDFVKAEQDPKIGVIKDIAAGAVLLSALFAAAVGAVVFFPAVARGVGALQRMI